MRYFSDYYSDAFVGGTLFPQVFWFVEFDIESKLPILLKSPRIRTSTDLITKKKWQGIVLKGTI